MQQLILAGGYVNDVVVAFQLLLENFHFVLFGVLVGMFFGVLPGMGGSVTLAVMLPFTVDMDPFSAFSFMAGGVASTTFAGSLTAILVSIPGTGSNAATLIDGYPLTLNGEANRAIGASAVSSATGAIVGVTLFITLVPVVKDFALLFGPAELFWLILWTLIIIPILIGDNSLLAMAFGALGALLSLVGGTPISTEVRFNFGMFFLEDGIAIVPAILGVFAIGELIRLTLRGSSTVSDKSLSPGGKLQGMKDVLVHKGLWFRSALIGIFMGILPGIGGSGATFLAYSHAVQSSDDSEGFGDGRIEGVIASEAANDAKDGGQLFPTLGLGIPGSGSMVVFLAALLFHGFIPGPRLLQTDLHLMLLIALSILVGNVLTSVIGLLFTGVFTKILDIPLALLVPTLFTLIMGAAYSVRNEFLDVIVTVLFGILGLFLIYLNVSRIPFIVAFILVSLMESKYVTAVGIAYGSPTAALFGEPITLAVIAVLFVPTIIYVVDPRRFVEYVRSS